MSFLFKSKKGSDRVLSSRDGGAPGSQSSLQGGGGRLPSEKAARSTPTGSLASIENEGSMGSPDHPARRGPSSDQAPQPAPVAGDPQYRSTPPPTAPANPNAWLYPWSQKRLNHTSSHSPFPRYGAATNSVASKEGDIYVMGGLINSSTVKGDLWMIEAGGSMSCYPLATTAEGPGPRVGHASLLVGNAFIVYGGDTKIDESDVLDETLYLLNTSTRQWSRALPAGIRPSGRYGHSLNILGSKIYIFGGQVEGFFMNDLSAFDLNQLQMPNNRWEMLLQSSDSGDGKRPPARTNHSMVTHNDKMYLFGGTNGFQWFNDVWCYDPTTNSWAQLDCIGYIPVPREGHSAALVDDVMYIFGGRTEEGADLGDLAAFRITSRRWYTFQNMGPSPSPRSGHSMTAVGKSVIVVGGEPSSPAASVNDLGLVYLLDTSKIRYPNDTQGQGQKAGGARRPSASEVSSQPPPRLGAPRDGSAGPPDAKRVVTSPTNSFKGQNGIDTNGGPPAMSKLPRAAPPGPVGPPPQGQPPKPAVNTARSRNTSSERNGPTSPVGNNQPQSPIIRDIIKEEVAVNGRRTPTYQPPAPAGPNSDRAPAEAPKPKPSRPARSQGSVDSSIEPGLKTVSVRPSSPPPPKQATNPLARRSSGRNSQTVALLKELDASRNRNAWYASELELARKAGYTSNMTMSPLLDGRGTESFDDDDKPLIEALLAMRAELANVQTSIDKQAVLAAKQVAEAEKQRDAAIQEAVYAKAKLAAHPGSATGSPQLSNDRDLDDRSNDISRKLAGALSVQKELQAQLDRKVAELEAEKRARKLADETFEVIQKRMVDLESFKQNTGSEVERLKAELHLVQREAREQSVAAAEAVAASDLLRIEKADFETKYNDAVGASQERGNTFDSLRGAVAASAEMKIVLERKLDEERSERDKLESHLNKLKAEYESRTAELVSATQRLRDAEELAARHANEARMHQQAVLAGLDKVSSHDVGGQTNKADADRVLALQSQLDSANTLVKKYQQQADIASDKLRSAEERIAGLEAYQEQASREGVSIRRQLQSALRDTQSLQAANSDLKSQLANQQLETNAVVVQHNTLKDILNERGISPTSRTRSVTSPRDDSPVQQQSRLRELEQQLSASLAAHEETKVHFTAQVQDTENAYREKLTQLENDYQSAVHYVKGTEKMLKQLKEQLARYKTENTRLKAELDAMEERQTSSAGQSASADWEHERSTLHQKIEELEQDLRNSAAQLEKQMQVVRNELDEAKRERDGAMKSHEELNQRWTNSKRDLEQLHQENSMLEQRANDAEQKVSLLLDQVESSVDNYRRRSRLVASMGSDQLKEDTTAATAAVVANTNGQGHNRTGSSEADSLYSGLGEARNSMALDNLANELESLRTHWEATNKNYRLSNTFDFETHSSGKKPEREDDPGVGLSESLADWRKRLDS